MKDAKNEEIQRKVGFGREVEGVAGQGKRDLLAYPFSDLLSHGLRRQKALVTVMDRSGFRQ